MTTKPIEYESLDAPSARHPLRDAWMRYWFTPQAPGAMGFCRMILFALLLWFYGPDDYATWGDLPVSFRNHPMFAFRLLHIPIASTGALLVIQFIWKLSLLTSCIGLFTRTSVWIAAITSFYMLGVPGHFGKMGHGEGILVITLFILAISRCGDAWSIDVLSRAYRRRDPNARDTQPMSGEYRWPIRMVWLLMALIMFAAGVAKLRLAGLDWVLSDNLSITILQHHYAKYGNPWSDLGIWIAQHKTLCKAMAAMTIVIELGFVIAPFSRWMRRTMVPAMFFSQVGIWILMGVSFLQFMFVYIFWIPWHELGLRVQRLGNRWPRHVMLYDGGCGFCRSAASVASRLDVFRRVEFIDVLHDWEAVHARFPQLDQQKCLTDIHMIAPDGTLRTRFDSYRRTARAIPAAWTILPLLYLPPVPQIGDRVYQYIATHRHDSGCEV